MSALSFLARRQLRNSLRQLLRTPSKLIVYALVLLSFSYMLFSPNKNPEASARYTDPRLLEGIYYGFLLLFAVPSLFNSLKSGATIFKMSDVNFLFVSPLEPKRILFYGLLKQTGATLLGFLFLLFYSGTLTQHFSISVPDVILLILFMVVLMVVIQVFAMLLYSFANGNPKRQTAVRAGLYVFLGVMAAAGAAVYLRTGGGLEGACAAFASPWLKAFPLIGWTEGAAFALLAGNAGGALFWCLLLAGAFALLLWLFLRSDADYYEDVLQRTESTYEAVQAVKENRAPNVRDFSARRKVKTGKTGLGGGWGANAFFYRQLREAKRRSRLVLLDPYSLVVLAVDLLLAFLFGRGGDGPSGNEAMAVLLLADVYILFLTSAVGDWARELTKPYVYLVPEPPYRKLLWAAATTALKPAADGLLFFAAAGVILGSSVPAAAVCVLVYLSFGLLFLAGNVLSQRVIGRFSNRGILMALFLLLLFLLSAPGIAAAVAVYFALGSFPEAARLVLAGLPCAGINLLFAMLIIYFCRNLLSDAESV